MDGSVQVRQVGLGVSSSGVAESGRAVLVGSYKIKARQSWNGKDV